MTSSTGSSENLEARSVCDSDQAGRQDSSCGRLSRMAMGHVHDEGTTAKNGGGRLSAPGAVLHRGDPALKSRNWTWNRVEWIDYKQGLSKLGNATGFDKLTGSKWCPGGHSMMNAGMPHRGLVNG
jgi:hypothetical protein